VTVQSGRGPNNPSPQSTRIAQGSICHRQNVIEIVSTSLRSFGLSPDPYGWDREIFLFGQNSPVVREFVALQHGQVAGVGISEYLGGSRATIRHLYVAENARRQGHGRRLLAHMTLDAREHGVQEMVLNTRKIFTAAVTLYESQGWTRVSTDTKETGPELTYKLSLHK
jgi:ribosomal protein S18 acetylase RimI-like enzyme